MGNSHWSGPLVQGTDPRPAASTNVLTNRLVVAAAASFQGAVLMASTLGVTGALTSGALTSGLLSFGVVGGGNRKLAAGTYIGSGAATAAIIAVGATIRHVFMARRLGNYSTATTTHGRAEARPAKANGTPGSFYPLVYRTSATNKNVFSGNGSGATWSWFAVCG